MKKAGILLVIITVVFSGFTLGFLLGRSSSESDVRVSRHDIPVSTTESTAPVETTLSAAVDINTANVEQLSTLPGIGPTLAQRIIDYREKNGSFSTTAELANVSGIGEKRLETLLEYITVGG